ncbi:MAG: sulfatase-like hydrolase/transferase, partial [Acidobacteriota bacterium]
YILAFHLALSLALMSALAHVFNFGRRTVLLHLSMVSISIAAITLCLGLSLFSRHVREKLVPKLLLSCVPAAGFAALLFLYLANYASNARWGNNFNYQVLAQWQFRAEILNSGGQILSTGVYVSLAVALAIIFGIYFALAKTIFRGLEELFLPHRPYSLFRDRNRSLISLTLIVIGVAASGFYLITLARNVNEVGHLMDEPIIGFFRTDTDSAEDLSRLSSVPVLRAQEQRFRTEYPRNQQFSRKNVIIIIVDSLRADHMQVYGYERPTTPFLSSLSATGHLRRVRFALATCPYTTCGVLSTLTSKNLRSQIPESFKLYELLSDQGYQVNFILSGNHNWYALKDSFGKGVDYYFDGTNSANYTANDDRVISEGLEKVPAYTGRPAFFYFHLMSTHYIGIKQERYRVYNPSTIEGTWESLVSGRYDAATKTNNYDNGVIQADATIQEIFNGLQQKGYLDDSLAVILSDHGEGLGERGPDYYSHTLGLYQEFLRIPLLIYDSPEAKYGNLEFASQVDVAPTVVNRLGLSIPPSWQGRSLLDTNIKQYTYHETRRYKVPIYAVIARTESAIYKYIHSAGKEDELYELVTDPRERRNLMATADASLIANMKTKLAEYLSRY